MKVIAILGCRSGKTTLLTHLAVDLASRGQRVTVVDTDDQTQELSVWARAIARCHPSVAMYPAYGLDADALRERFKVWDTDVVLLDTPSVGEAAVHAALAAADTSLVLLRADDEGRRVVYQHIQPLVNRLENDDGRQLDVRLLLNGVEGVLSLGELELLRRMPWPVMASRIPRHPAMAAFGSVQVRTDGRGEPLRTELSAIRSVSRELGLSDRA